MKENWIKEAQEIISKIDEAIQLLENPKEFINSMDHGFTKTTIKGVAVEDYSNRQDDYNNIMAIASQLLQLWDDKTQCRPLARWAFDLEAQNSGRNIITLGDFVDSRIGTVLFYKR
jgi:hypothetical protein